MHATKVNTILPFTLIRSGGLPMVHLDRLGKDWSALWEANKTAIAHVAEQRAAILRLLDAYVGDMPESAARTAVYNTRKQLFKAKSVHWPQLWTDLQHEGLKVEALQPLVAGLERAILTAEAVQTNFERQWTTFLSENYADLQKSAQDEAFQRGLLYASHDLLQALPAFLVKSPTNFSKKERQTALSIYQYVARAAVKTSPFSHFTCVDFQRIEQLGEEQAFSLGKKCVVIPNVAILEALYVLLLRVSVFYRSLSLRLNPWINEIAEVHEYYVFDGSREALQIIEMNEVVEVIVNYFLTNDRKPCTFLELLKLLSDKVAATPTALTEFLLDLTDFGLLAWELPETGMSGSWCSKLYEYLGHLSSTSESNEDTAILVETAFLLQWLRTNARTLPYQPVNVAMSDQQTAAKMLMDFFAKHQVPCPYIAPEKVFYEDVSMPVHAAIAQSEFEHLLQHLQKTIREDSDFQISAEQAAMSQFYRVHFPEKKVPLMAFVKAYLAHKTQDAQPATTKLDHLIAQNTPVRYVGALLQIFRTKEGTLGAVINALFPAGGKLMSRWIPLANHKQTLTHWVEHIAQQQGTKMYVFGWQGWYNANVVLPTALPSLVLHGNRLPYTHPATIIPAQIQVVYDDKKGLSLLDVGSNQFIQWFDFGLEAIENRPPVVQIIGMLGGVNISVTALQNKHIYDEQSTMLRYFPRETKENLVVRRAAWQLSPKLWEAWLQEALIWKNFFAIKTFFEQNNLPSLVFYRFFKKKDKTQYLDVNSPISILLFIKMLNQGEGTLELVEMLPQSDQLVVEQAGNRVGEFVVEIQVT